MSKQDTQNITDRVADAATDIYCNPTAYGLGEEVSWQSVMLAVDLVKAHGGAFSGALQKEGAAHRFVRLCVTLDMAVQSIIDQDLDIKGSADLAALCDELQIIFTLWTAMLRRKG